MTLTGGVFDARDYFCMFGDVPRPAAVAPGGATAVCTTPLWPRAAGVVPLELLVDGAPLHRDGGAGAFEFLAGPPARLNVTATPGGALGGLPCAPGFELTVEDDAGNAVLPFEGEVQSLPSSSYSDFALLIFLF